MLVSALDKRIVVETLFQQIVLRSALEGEPRDILVAQAAQDQDRNVGRCAEQLVEGLDALAVGEEKIDHDRCEVFPSCASPSRSNGVARIDSPIRR